MIKMSEGLKVSFNYPDLCTQGPANDIAHTEVQKDTFKAAVIYQLEKSAGRLP